MVKFPDYQIWTDNLLIEKLQEIPDEILTKNINDVENTSLLHSISHIVGTFDLWLKRLKGISLKEFPHFEKDKNKEELFSLWKSYNAEIRKYFKDTVIEDVVYRNTKNQKFMNTKEDILTHIILYTAYYRGMIVYTLRVLGYEVEDRDFIHFRRMDQIS